MMKSFVFLTAASFLLGACAAQKISYPTGDSAKPYLYDGCAWETKNVPVKVEGRKYVLEFRAQTCKDKFLQASYDVKGNELRETRLQQTDDGPQKMANTILYLWPYDSGTFKYKIEKLNEESLKPEEKGRCHVVYESASDTYTYEPEADYMKEMLAKNEPFAACGDFGFNNDKASYFGVLDDKLLAFFDIGQEAPLYDPNSFRVTQ